jgi:hypothetical protein
VSKVIEAIVCKNIVAHLEEHHLLNNSQFGFRRGYSCTSNLLKFIDDLTFHMDKKTPVDALYLDFAKAFDKVPHKRLIKKVISHGIQGNVAGWIQAWLEDRKQRVCVGGESSDWSGVTSGVPQGSVLGPTLFLIYIDDLEDNTVTNTLKFADDTKLYRPVVNREEADILQQDLDLLVKWAEKWKMEFNVKKCKVVHFGSNNQRHKYHMGNNNDLQVSEAERDLGVTVHQSLKWGSHIAEVVKKANRSLGIIKRTFTSRKMAVMLPLYKAFVRPHVEYAVQVWSPYFIKDINLIEKVQRRFSRMISECRGLEYPDRLAVLGLSTLEERRTRGDIIQTFKMIKDIDRTSTLVLRSEKTDRATKGHHLRLYKRHCNTLPRKNYFSFRVTDPWNKLPEAAVNCTNINALKGYLKPAMMEGYMSQR